MLPSLAINTMQVLVPDWIPPSRENYEFIYSIWIWYPAVASLQWVISWYGMGKTSVYSRFNLPGRMAWFTMEVPGPSIMLYMMTTLPAQQGITDLPWQNKVLTGLFLFHYAYRAVLYPLIQPSMSPIHLLIWLGALVFQCCNATCLGSWLCAYGPISSAAWASSGSPSILQFSVGVVLFYVGLASNYFHDDELRDIRRRALGRQQNKKTGSGVDKLYRIPRAGLFRLVLFPHYLSEWVEWFGFWTACGFGCGPARAFFVAEVSTMLPRAVRGRQWYVKRFGEENLRGKKAVVPGII